MENAHNRIQKSTLFLRSALTEQNPFMRTESVGEWMQDQAKNTNFDVQRISFSQLVNWSPNPKTGDIEHVSGKFFTIFGINVRTNGGYVPEWEQPIINQPEVGLLGILTKCFDGVLYFLMQAKCEPGNINGIQLSPTLQATKSNFLQVHQGKKPLFLDHFLNFRRHNVLFDQLQSEQGGRYLHKRNRNIILEVSGDLPIPDNYCWLTLGQIKRLMLSDNLINMDARTVISGIPFGSYDSGQLDFFTSLVFPGLLSDEYKQKLFISAVLGEKHLYSEDDILSWFANLKAKYDLFVEKIPLQRIRDWVFEDGELHHESGKYFSVIAVDVKIGNREVAHWTQPMMKSAQEGIIVFVTKEIHGVLHFLVQAKIEAGNLDVVELAPTVQCITGDYRDVPVEQHPSFLDYSLNVPKSNIRYSALQSEEGGRFYQEENRYMIIEADEDFPIKVPENYTWMTLNQLNTFIKFSNYVNIQARSLLATISFI